ncbi:MAG: AzlC family ABC transporter permease, partial [Firmicutes bacterium]|nr:AzlC family ABC transporter permease [Bacillota bacterium]
MKNNFKKAFIISIPVMIAFIFLGISYGMLMEENGYGPTWSFFISLFTFAGAAQFAMVAFLSIQMNPLIVFIIILVINARHLFYGISMLDEYRNYGALKWYLMGGLTDETFSLVRSIKFDEKDDKKEIYLFITLLNHSYWVIGSVLGGVLGSVLQFEIIGLDFILTALFVSVFASYLKNSKIKYPGYIGLGVSIFTLLIFQDNFIIPAMGIMVLLLLL